MNPKTKKCLIIIGLALDILITILLFVFSVVIIALLPENKFEIDPTTFIGWFQSSPIRILLLDVLPLCLLLALNIVITVTYIRKTTPAKKKAVTLNDLSDEEKEALRKKILQEMLEESNNK